jgi:O-antigen ligase
MRGASGVAFILLLACPLYAWPDTGFDALRLPVVLGLSCALLATAFVRAARGGERPPGPAPLRTAGVLLLGAHLLSLTVARTIADAAVPILILFAGLAIFAGLRNGVVSRESATALMPAIPVLGLIVGAISVAQAAMGKPVVSLEGNGNYAGALAAMLLPAAVAFTRTGPVWSRWLSGLSAAALGAMLLLSESRGGLVAGVVGVGIAAAAMGAKHVRRGAAVAGISLLVLLTAFGVFQGRSQVSPERMETAGFRTEVWKSGLRMAAARPVLGWGAGNFAVEYPPFRSEAEFRYSHKYVTDAFKELEDAHSSWVQVAVETGAPGLLALLLVVYVAARLWRYYVKVAPDADRAALLAGLGGGAAAYLVAGVFNTLTLKTSHTVLFWSFLGLIELIGDPRLWRASMRSREGRVALPAAAAFVAFFGMWWAATLGLGDGAFSAGMSTSKASEREAKLRESLDRNPYWWRPHYELSLTLSAVERYQGAIEEGRATLRLRPHHLDALNHTAISLLRTGGAEREVEALFRRAVEIAPYYYKSLHNFALFERQRGNRAEARRLFGEAIEHNRDYASSYFCRGLLSWSGGDAVMAIEDFRKAQSLGLDVGRALRSERVSAENDVRLAEFFK